MIYLLLILATLVTSFISGVLSMAGGMILMGVFSLILSIPAAMVLHGVAQTVSNGTRVWIYREHIRWKVLVPYSIASVIILTGFILISLVPDKALVFLMIGSFPFLALSLPKSIDLNMEKPAIAFLCGLLVTTAQMLAGASGPVLDIFYIQSQMSRREILGTKAITQTLGHIMKLGYYASFLALNIELDYWLFPAVVVAAFAGNWIGKLVVERIKDSLFKTVGRVLILLIGGIYIAEGLGELGWIS